MKRILEKHGHPLFLVVLLKAHISLKLELLFTVPH